jgi:hypothetical protein
MIEVGLATKETKKASYTGVAVTGVTVGKRTGVNVGVTNPKSEGVLVGKMTGDSRGVGVSNTLGVHVGVGVDKSWVGDSITMNPVALGVTVGICAAEVAVAAMDVSVASTAARAVAIGGSRVAVGRAVTGVVTPTVGAAGVPPATRACVGVGSRDN